MDDDLTRDSTSLADAKPVALEEAEETKAQHQEPGLKNDQDGGTTQSAKKRRRRRRKNKKGTEDGPETELDKSIEMEDDENSRPTTTVSRTQQREDRKKLTDEGPGDEHEKETPSGDKKKRKRNRKKKTNTLENAEENEEKGATVTDSPIKDNTPGRPNGKHDSSPNRRRACYQTYWSKEDVSDGLKRGELLKGPLRINKKNYELAWVSVAGLKRDVMLEGMVPRNRALEGDVVALQLLPRSMWKVASAELEQHKASVTGKNKGVEGLADNLPGQHKASVEHVEGKDKDIEVLADFLAGTHLSPAKETAASQKQLAPTKLRNDDVPDEFLQRTATVVYIIEKKHSRAAGGHLKPFTKKHNCQQDGQFSPTDSRLPRLRIPHELCPPGFFERPQDFANTLFVARITDWPSTFDNFYARGMIVRSLGEAGEIMPETEAILYQYEVDSGPFPDEALACLPKTPWVIPEEELAKRRDFRGECVFTIDPLTARDLDDALHCKRLPDGNIEVGVHIADVSYFVRQGTALDDVAQERATSTYMVQMVVPMLPRLLCEQLCSLNPDEDRLTVSVVWTMNDKGEILSDWKGRSVIRSRVKLAYEHAHDMIQTPDKKWEEGELPPISQGTDAAEIASKVCLLHKIAVQLRRNRYANGALRLDQAKLRFDLDRETGLPDGYSLYEQRDSNRLIEEFMLLANMAVAHHIYNAFPQTSLLRRHPKPDPKQLDDLINLCQSHGIQFNAQTSKAIQQSLARFPSASAIHEILVQYTMKPMRNAEYFCSGSFKEAMFSHYALSVPFYTHFTSPIRRYADIIVHRLLVASLGLDEKIDEQKADIDHIARNCNDRKSAAKYAGELSNELFFALFVRECGPLEHEGFVLAVMDQSFDVFIPAVGLTRRIYFKFCLNAKRYELVKDSEHKQTRIKLVWLSSGGDSKEFVQILSVFSEVRVTLTTESQVEEKSDKPKPIRVYARIQPPDGAVGIPVKKASTPREKKKPEKTIGKSPSGSTEVRKTLFVKDEKVDEKGEANPASEGDDVIVEDD